MNAIDFIDLFLTQNDPTTRVIKAEQAYSSYINYCQNKNVETSTYPYFRTKFNNKLKDISVASNPSENIDIEHNDGLEESFIIPIVEELENDIFFDVVEARVELTRSVKNYKTGDEVPTPPSLIPTGCLFDRLISDRVTTDKDMENYQDKEGNIRIPNVLKPYLGGMEVILKQ